MLSSVALVLAVVMAAGFSVLAVWLATGSHDRGAALLIAALALFQWGLADYVRRDRQGKSGGMIALSDAGIDLDLAANRSLIHRPSACRGHYPWTAVTGVLTREEAYGAQGMAMLQRPYWLAMATGAPILLFEERALGTSLQDGSLGEMVDEIARRGGVPVTELPTVLGRGGLLGTWFARPPAPGAPPLEEAARSRLARRVRITGALAAAAMLVVALVRTIG